jgi:hypothetical protein
MKKIFLTITALMLTLSLSLPAFASFPDVSESDASYTAISLLSALGIVDGDENGLFNPTEKVTRAEFAKLIVSLIGQENTANILTTTDFEDSKNHWAAGYIQVGVSLGYIDGYDDTHFGPEDTITYSQALKILVSVLGYDVYAKNSGGYPTGYITYANSLGITKNISGATTDTKITRELAAVLIYNSLNIPIVETSYDYSRVSYNTMDGKSGREYKTMLTEAHDTYIVLGRVTATSRLSKALSKNQVTYQVENSDNFDGKAYNKNTESVTMNIGGTGADSLLYYYTEAYVQKNTSNDEFTILSITVK